MCGRLGNTFGNSTLVGLSKSFVGVVFARTIPQQVICSHYTSIAFTPQRISSEGTLDQTQHKRGITMFKSRPVTSHDGRNELFGRKRRNSSVTSGGENPVASLVAAAGEPRKRQKQFPPSRCKVDEDGTKWRLCAGAAVLNSENHVLIGERVHVRDSWQTPQGGVDDAWEKNDNKAETITKAAHRELYEEVGLKMNEHVVLEKAADENESGCRYETTGTDDWMSKLGYAGQKLHWSVYRCMQGHGDEDPYPMCDLSGKNGEEAEFLRVKWAPIDEVLENIWPKKRPAYENLRKILNPIMKEWEIRCKQLDLSGTWSRDASLSSHVVLGLVARGLQKDQAKVKAEQPYIQHWSREDNDTTVWKVTTFEADGKTIRRKIDYKMGNWKESYEGKSSIFGRSVDDAKSSVKRRTMFLAEPDADQGEIAHVTLSQTSLGREESRRYIKEGRMVLRRTFLPGFVGTNNATVSTEVFVRLDK